MKPLKTSVSLKIISVIMVIVSVTGTFVPSSYTTRDCFTFVSKLKSLTNFKHCIMASMDVESLFTNSGTSLALNIFNNS